MQGPGQRRLSGSVMLLAIYLCVYVSACVHVCVGAGAWRPEVSQLQVLFLSICISFLSL